jgi:hypothetical protein
MVIAIAASQSDARAWGGRPPVVPAKAYSSRPFVQQVRAVSNCEDSGPGSLRDTIKNVAQSGDTVDLTNLGCSSITLNTGEIQIDQDDLTIQNVEGKTTLSAAGNSRIFSHQGSGTLAIVGLFLRDGYFRTNGDAHPQGGGCIYSKSAVHTTNSIFTNCVASGYYAAGGAIYAHGLWLDRSVVTTNQIADCPGSCFGGGVASQGTLISTYSSLDQNSNASGVGGGAISTSALIIASTLDHNSAGQSGAINISGNVTLQDSTVSYNSAVGRSSAIEGDFTPSDSSFTIVASTIARNYLKTAASPNTCEAAAICIFNGAAGSVSIYSSIISKNRDINGLPSDVHLSNPVSGVTGAFNLIEATNVTLPGFASATDPRIGPLQFNGGSTKTHQLLIGSPAIGMGDASIQLPYDQRGEGYRRKTGPGASIDIGAVQFDEIFVWSD